MNELNSPQIADDGAHLIPIKNIRRAGCEMHPDATGLVQWQPKEGVSFEIVFPGVSPFGVGQYYQPPPSAGAAGALQQASPEAEWHAETGDGQTVALYTTLPQVTHRHAIRNRTSEQRAAVSGRALYALVQLHRDNPLAFWHETTPDPRLFFAGVAVHRWPELTEVEYTHGDSTCTRMRSFLHLADEPRLVLMGSWQEVLGEGCGWLVFDPKERLTNDKWFTDDCESVRCLLSFATGKSVPFLWKDKFVDETTLERTYYGWQRVPVERGHVLAPLPLGGTIESLRFGQYVCKAMPSMLAQLQAISSEHDVSWIMSPIWTASGTFADDKLALACVSVERLTQAHQQARRRQVQSGGEYTQGWLQQQASEQLRGALLLCLESEVTRLGIQADVAGVLRKRIDNLTQLPNANKLESTFADLGIALTEQERATISTRNKCLHGVRTLGANHGLAALGSEIERFETLVSIVQKAVLKLLNYTGPYVDYADRPTTGNFPIKFL